MIWFIALAAVAFATAFQPSLPVQSKASSNASEDADAPPKISRGPMLVEIVTQNAPQIARTGGADYLVYELHLTNFVPTLPMTITGVTAIPTNASEVRPCITHAGDRLADNFRLIGPQRVTGQPTTLGPGQRAMLYVWLPLVDATSVPSALSHSVRLRLQGVDRDYLIDSRPVAVGNRAPLRISAPVAGGRWVAVNGPTPSAIPDHNRLLYPRLGEIHVPQRFATDWVKLGRDGRFFSEEPTKNDDYPSYNEPVLAVSRGTVAAVHDGVPDNRPPEVNEGLSQADRAGNYVVLDLGGGHFAFYGHLKRGSITVRPGTTVAKGQVLGRIGNSGNSTGPHLHFHLTDGPSLGSEGIAFVFSSYVDHGKLGMTLEDLEAGKPFVPRSTPTSISNDLPLGQTVVSFAGGTR